ncbi:MAG: FG-GAP repeat domain-containing protein [Chthoniobacterales bacterium]
MFSFWRVSQISALASAFALSPILHHVAHAQSNPPKARNLLANGSFESSFRRDNPWDGVSRTGTLIGNRGSLPILTQSGSISDNSMPVSVSIADMNNDGLNDIVTSDVFGYMRIYFNAGSKTEPKFTTGELIPVFISRGRDRRLPEKANQGVRIAAANFSGGSSNDLVIGNYIGEIMLLKNAGSPMVPKFVQPPDVSKIIIPTSKDGRRWGNVFDPTVADINKDGKPDLLIGEGSYSANSIHLLINQGSAAAPKFDDPNRFFLVYGMGREQLSSAVVDYNGDGKDDIIMTDRMGVIGVYLNPGSGWEPGKDFPFASNIAVDGKAGSDLRIGGISTIATGDMNGDGLFDLVVGKSNGRVAMALNTGTKTEPKFKAFSDVKGQGALPLMQLPSGWETHYGLEEGNFLGYISVVDAESDKVGLAAPNGPQDGKKVLKAGYYPNPNKVVEMAYPTLPAVSKGGPALDLSKPNWQYRAWYPSNFFMFQQAARMRLKIGKTYEVSFKVRGNKVRDATAFFVYRGYKKLGEARITRGERGSAKVKRNELNESKSESIRINPSANWTTVTQKITVKFTEEKDLNKEQYTSWASLLVAFTLQPGQGEIFFDDFKVTEMP